MAHLAAFFNPIEIDKKRYPSELLGGMIDFYAESFPDLAAADIVFMGCPCEIEGREGTAMAPDAIREELYQLAVPNPQAKIADVGNLIMKNSPQEWGELIGYVVEKLLKMRKIVILLGGSKEIAYGQTLAYRYTGVESEESATNYVYISPFLDLKDRKEGTSSVNYRIFNQYPPSINVFTNIGYQSYKVTAPEMDLMRNLSFPSLRYGILHGNIFTAEPHLREADAVCLDVSAIRHSDSPGGNAPLPAGFSVMEICQLARYAGNSHHISTFSLTEYNALADIHAQTAIVSSMILWYFLEGIYQRRVENPTNQPENFKKYRVKVNAGIEEIAFFQSELTGLWWMEVCNAPNSVIVPCSESEYQSVVADEIPEKWWQVFNRLV